MIIDEATTLNELERLYEKYGQSDQVSVLFVCSVCGKDFELELQKTSHGFGMNGGVLFMSLTSKRLSMCMDCYKATFDLDAYKI